MIIDMYRYRAIEKVIAGSMATPVLILEGARAVGKSTFVQHLVDRGEYQHYATLADPATQLAAEQDISGWLESLPRPAVIDEAQLVSALPLAVKELVDFRGSGHHFLLTGSASIGRSGLGGADPLVRRARRHEMSPLTATELRGEAENAPSVIDQLFDADIISGAFPVGAEGRLLDALRIGGFPTYALQSGPLTRSALYAQVRSDVESTLGDSVLPDERFDAFRARAVLDALLRTPGGILNLSALGDQMGLDRRTIDRYLDVLERRFMLRSLPNLATNARHQGRARSKIHPVDTSLTAESLSRAGQEIETRRELFGQLLESYVVNQVLPSREWAELPTDVFYWREASRTSPEIDLVLLDGQGRHVGVEVKASRTISRDDLKGFRSLRERRSLHRGFIVYTGDEVIKLDSNIWAIPVDALGDRTVFAIESARSESTVKRVTEGIVSVGSKDTDATIFVSYVHSDNEYLDGAITNFARDLVKSYSFLYGGSLDLFIDSDDILWGEQWKQRLDRQVQDTSFLLAMVTPQYLKSEACRRELLQFSSAAKKAGAPRLLLSLIWTEPSGLDVVSDDDPVLREIRAAQYLNGTDLLGLERGTLGYRRALEEIAGRLRESIVQRERVVSREDRVETGGSEDDDLDVIEVMEAFDASKQPFQDAAVDFQNAFVEIGKVFSETHPSTSNDTYATAAALAKMGRDFENPVAELEKATSVLADQWHAVDGLLTRLAQITAEVADEATIQETREVLAGFARDLDLPGMEQMEQQLQMLGRLSRHLRPVGRALQAALAVIVSIRDSALSWKDVL